MFPKYLIPIEAHSILELVLGAIIAAIFWPIGFVIYIVNVTLRFLAQKACDYFYPQRYIIAAGEDSVFGIKLSGSSNSYIQGIKVIRGDPDIDLIRAKFQQLFTRTTGYDKLKHMLTHKFGYFCWDTKIPFDVNRHIRLLDDFDPEEIVDEDRLVEICSSLVAKDCGYAYGDNMAQWEFLMIPKYRKAGEFQDEKTSHYALIVRIHHAYCDGISFVLLTNDFLADTPGELPIDPFKELTNPIWVKVYIWAKVLIIGPMNFIINLGKFMIHPSLYRVERYLNSKVLAKSSSFDMNVLRKIRIASGTSVTSITISIVYAALYKTHLRKFEGKPVPKKLHLASVGVMLPYNPEKKLVNQFTMWPYAAQLKVDDPKQRLAMTFAEVRRCASQPDPIFDFYIQRALGSLPKILHGVLFNLSGTPVMLSNVPGYKTQVKLFGGELVDAAAWIPLVTTTGIGLSTQSYCGRMHFSAVADPQIFATSAELKRFLEDIVKEIDHLAEAYGVVNGEDDSFLAELLSKGRRQSKFTKNGNDNEGGVLSQPKVSKSAGTLNIPNNQCHERTVNSDCKHAVGKDEKSM